MREKNFKFKMGTVVAIATALMAFSFVYMFPDWIDSFMEKMKAGGTFSSIVYAFSFIIGFNLLILLISKLSNKKKSAGSEIHKVRKAVRSSKARRTELKQAYFNMGQG